MAFNDFKHLFPEFKTGDTARLKEFIESHDYWKHCDDACVNCLFNPKRNGDGHSVDKCILFYDTDMSTSQTFVKTYYNDIKNLMKQRMIAEIMK